MNTYMFAISLFLAVFCDLRSSRAIETRGKDPVPRIPVLTGKPWPIAGDPDLGALTDPRQQPVDFAIWRAADGAWQLWSCIRGTKCGGKTRLFYRWEARQL